MITFSLKLSKIVGEDERMKISTKGRYGLRAMIDLALNAGEGHVSLKSIADRQDISECYLEQLILNLKKAGLVISIRGAQGGYKLDRHPKEISIGEILRALEGSLAPVECVENSEESDCCRSDFCVQRVIWEKIRDSVNSVVDSISLHDIVEDYMVKSNSIEFDKLIGGCSNG